ncbi:hypothetical protein AB0O82_32765 [Kitasatospora sp. NPDC088264]|uniref:hypothetical protein n=1 Tax=Kitasatospora sp. NPDC088264 TaxID=3155296 RepID=UPI003440BB53
MTTQHLTLDGYLQESPRLSTAPDGHTVLRWRLLLPLADDQGDYSLITCLLPDPRLGDDDSDGAHYAAAYPAGTYVQVTGHLHLPTPDEPQLLLVAAGLATVEDPADEPMPASATVHQVLPYGPYICASVTTPADGTWWHLWDRGGRFIGQARDIDLLGGVIATYQAGASD